MINKLNPHLKLYIENNILPEYNLNDSGHGIKHIEFVLKRAYELSTKYNVDINMLYTVVCFHDIACHIDRKRHEVLSAEKLYNDKCLKQFFTEEEILIMKQAVEDHRASLEYIPRNIYGKILSSADRKVDLEDYLKTSMGFYLKANNNSTKEQIIEDSYEFAIKKFGKQGYATTKMYIEDDKYQKFLDEIQYLIDNKDKFVKKANTVYEEYFNKNI